MARKKTKTDNTSPAVKLALRRQFLEKYHNQEPPHVLDCCQGEGRIWKQLRADGVQVASYWGVDIKPKRGRLRIDSVGILAQRGWTQNVIDIDTYGSPWQHWLAMLPNVKHPVTVFLTVGVGGPRLIRLDKDVMRILGLPEGLINKKWSGALTHSLLNMSVRYCLHEARKYDLEIVEAVEAYERHFDPTLFYWRTRYYGVRLEPVQ